jgi:hypothetical protein
MALGDLFFGSGNHFFGMQKSLLLGQSAFFNGQSDQKAC